MVKSHNTANLGGNGSMLIGSLGKLDQGYVTLPHSIRKALEYLKNHDLRTFESGRYDIEEGVSYAVIERYKTRLMAKCRPEVHEKYVDIQCVVEGEEYLGWCPLSPDLKIVVPYDAERDIAFYEALVPESNFILSAGNYAILYPNDVHRPQTAIDKPSAVTKVVVKVRVDSL